ncbi:YwmB family TATA-box binding protein [Anaerobacillus isosaccharinicus]|uniref:YwmB family TATA-box binding protein n=1 Tax=Anaerobacillus isosaccharinicus TaxID=1532552 RepID=A0A1S2M6H7_9BACI|nr:YwmB family TATA-box binding protein [Anaerobacillus isosaccharinicus]MBA5584385.1 YwmB family TATA-box binding protein [Anaerobacillus isosaccharinicus]QOY37222.1 YwmB family TATA-box binding protein [Anaerobacillus isosaccharinicus]
MGNKKRKDTLQVIFYCIILFSLYFGLNWSGEATDEKPFRELEKILEVMDKHEIELKDWTLYSREHLNSWNASGEYENELHELMIKTNEFDWQPLFDDDLKGQKKAVASLNHQDFGVTEMLTYIIYPHNEQLHSYLIYDINGTEKLAADEWKSISPVFSSRLEDLFTNNTKIFTCASGIGSDKLNFGLITQADRLLAEFSAETIESLKEETFISISAYTNTWNNAIATNGQNMNLQVAIRAIEGLGGKTTVTIGTPIITTEY